MRGRECTEEPRILAAVRSGDEDPFVAEHLAGCPSCRELAEVAGWLRQLAHASDEGHDLPAPAEIWWKAQPDETLR